jgi:phosphotransferase family enzyme
MVTASGVRIGWGDLPGQVRDAIADILGGEVVVALAISDVDGRHPWRFDGLASTRVALDEPARVGAPPDLPAAAAHLVPDFTGRHRRRADPSSLDQWTATHLDELSRLAEHGLAGLAGNTLTHTDIRADNLTIGAAGAVTVVDWPHATRGPAWLDTLMLLVDVRLPRWPPRPGRDLRRPAPTWSASVPGAFFAAATRLPPPDLPSPRTFQRAHADARTSWLRELWTERRRRAGVRRRRALNG